MEALERADRLSPDEPPTQLALAELEVRAGEYESARRNLEAVLSEDPGPEIRDRAGELLEQTDRALTTAERPRR